jgi:hypothetical protein
MHKLNFFIEDKAKVITWLYELNQIDNELFGQGNIAKLQRGVANVSYNNKSSPIITTALSMTEHFNSLPNLQYFSLIKNEMVYMGNYPNRVDLALYELMRQ